MPESVYKLLHEGEFDKARTELLKLHNNGNYEASRLIGAMMMNGDGFEQNMAQGREYLNHAHTNGNVEATFYLGISYREENARLYARLQEKAARQGHLIAAQQIGLAYFTGEGVKHNDIKAYFWLFSIQLRTYVAAETWVEPLEALIKRMHEPDQEAGRIMAWNLVYRDLKQGFYQEEFDKINPPEYGPVKKGNYKIVDGEIHVIPPERKSRKKIRLRIN